MRQNLKHILIILAIWTAVMLFEGLFVYVATLSDRSFTFEFEDILKTWEQTLPFAILYIIHDLAIAPLLTDKKKLFAYIPAAAAILALFSFYCIKSAPTRIGTPNPPFQMENLVKIKVPPQRNPDLPPGRGR